MAVQKEATVLCVPESKLRQDHSLAVYLPFLCGSLADLDAFDLEDREQRQSARLGKDTKHSPQIPSFPFREIPIQPPHCSDPGEVIDPQLN